MQPAAQRFRRFAAPHPLVMLVGIAVLAVLAWLRFALGFLSGSNFIIAVVLFLFVFTRVSRRSARKMRERHQRELEELRGKPILHLNDPD
jgi:membrane protein implicated in regulation of membrane protease activity